MELQSYTLAGATFRGTEEAIGAFACFDPDRPESTDRGPYGMVEEMRTFARLTSGMKTFVDIGALFGVFSLVFTQQPGTKAFAFEPSPWAYPILEEQCAANPDRWIQPVNCFVGGVANTFAECGRDWKHVIAGEFTRTDERVTLPISTLDELLSDSLVVDCMKIDVEGFEGQVLRGAVETLRRNRPLIFLECHFADVVRHGDSPESIMGLIRDAGLRVTSYTGEPIDSFDAMSFVRVLCVPA